MGDCWYGRKKEIQYVFQFCFCVYIQYFQSDLFFVCLLNTIFKCLVHPYLQCLICSFSITFSFFLCMLVKKHYLFITSSFVILFVIIISFFFLYVLFNCVCACNMCTCSVNMQYVYCVYTGHVYVLVTFIINVMCRYKSCVHSLCICKYASCTVCASQVYDHAC